MKISRFCMKKAIPCHQWAEVVARVAAAVVAAVVTRAVASVEPSVVTTLAVTFVMLVGGGWLGEAVTAKGNRDEHYLEHYHRIPSKDAICTWHQEFLYKYPKRPDKSGKSQYKPDKEPDPGSFLS